MKSFDALLKSMSWSLWGAILLFAANGCASRPSPALSQPPVHVRGHHLLRVATYNVFVGTRDFEQSAQVIRALDADVVALQEVPTRSAVILDRALAADYPYRFFSGRLGILSRFPLREPRFQASKLGLNGFLFAKIQVRGQTVQFANLHLDPLRSWTLSGKLLLPVQIVRQGNIQQTELNQVFANLNKNLPTILSGDFNRVADRAIDRLKDFGYIDSFAQVHRQPDHFKTLRFRWLGLEMGKRIDFIFHDSRFQTLESRTVPGLPSDHDAVVSVLQQKNPI